MPTDSFLDGFPLRPVTLESAAFEPIGLGLGQGPSAVEVLVTRTARPPGLPAVRALWRQRHARRAAPLLVVVLSEGRVTLCGPVGDDPPAYEKLDVGQAERLCREALEQPDRHAALRFLRDALPAAAESQLPGLRNEGFLATHELAVGARLREDWPEAGRQARAVLAQPSAALLRALGFHAQAHDQLTSILRAGPAGSRLAVAVLLHQAESPELNAERFNGMSPVDYAMYVADRESLPYVLVAQGSRLRLYPVRRGVGVGRRGATETYVEIHTGLLADADAAYLWLLFSAEALALGGSLDWLLEESRRFAGDLAERLRERVYSEVIPRLARGLAAARGLRRPTARDLAETYEMAMTVLFRLLFISYAEDKNLLPYRWNGLYRRRALKTKAQELLEKRGQSSFSSTKKMIVPFSQPFDDGDSLWKEVDLLFRAVEAGNTEWGVPEYDGGLFARNPEVSRVGALLADVSLPNTVMGPALRHLLVIETQGEAGPVDFRSLSVREFGTIYEGLLESELSMALVNLTLDERNFYRPCQAGEEPLVTKSQIYLHNRSSARKATGTYFTKEFAVEHLLERALEPALADHLARLDGLDDDAAGERFFDFRVADIAMGSGHFLVAAVDRIERAFTRYLARRPLAGVRHELARLRASAAEALGSLAEQAEIEDTQLLRRLIARRCIYGVDLNPVAVNLARLSIWIHTFVPGLPLSLLDHNLVAGNSLVGVGRIEEIEERARAEAIDPDNPSQPLMFAINPQTLLGDALAPLHRLAHIADATAAEVHRARKAMAQARTAVKPAAALCDIATACRTAGEPLPVELTDWEAIKDTLVDSRAHKAARKRLLAVPPFHFPVAFPEVFLRERPGFDVIIGNPPWQKATLEEHAFWARHEPGLRGLNQREQERLKSSLRAERPDLVELYEQEVTEAEALRKALVCGPYPGMGTGDPDLYKAFCWRFWRLIVPTGGWMGVVLPRSAWHAKGSAAFRVEVFRYAETADIATLVNNRQWVFPEVDPRYSIALTAVCRDLPVGKAVRLRGPFASLERFTTGILRAPAEFTGDEIQAWTDSASLPLLPTEESLAVFAQLRKSPRLDLDDGRSWRTRPYTELHATNDKSLLDVESEDCPRGFWPVYKGESFDIWEPDTGRYYAWADPKKLIPHLQAKRLRGGRTSSSPFSEFDGERLGDEKTLPCHQARVAFRDISRATDSRTVRVALVPPKVFITHQAPTLVWPRGDEKDQAFLLGVLASLSLDWYARRFVETHLSFFVLNPFPIPRPPRGSRLWQRVVALAGRLAAVDGRYARWAKAVGVACGALGAAAKDDAIHELDAVVAHLYGLEEKHLVHLFETFHEGWDYADRLQATLVHYRAWEGRT